MWIASARHRHRAGIVAEPVIGLVGNRAANLLALHLLGEATALNHESVDDAVEHGAIVEAFLHVAQEVGDRLWRLVWIKLEGELPHGRYHLHARWRLGIGSAC